MAIDTVPVVSSVSGVDFWVVAAVFDVGVADVVVPAGANCVIIVDAILVVVMFLTTKWQHKTNTNYTVKIVLMFKCRLW